LPTFYQLIECFEALRQRRLMAPFAVSPPLLPLKCDKGIFFKKSERMAERKKKRMRKIAHPST
jgi:hypothetical protein